MTYLEQQDREEILSYDNEGRIVLESIYTPDELHFVVQELVEDYLGEKVLSGSEDRYDEEMKPRPPTFNDYSEIIGVLEMVKLALYRQMERQAEEIE